MLLVYEKRESRRMESGWMTVSAYGSDCYAECDGLTCVSVRML